MEHSEHYVSLCCHSHWSADAYTLHALMRPQCSIPKGCNCIHHLSPVTDPGGTMRHERSGGVGERDREILRTAASDRLSK